MRNPFFITLLALIVMLIVSLAIGSVFIPPAELWRLVNGTSDSDTFRTILWNIRLPRTALIALIGAAGRMTYRELNRRANQLAHELRGHGVGPETRVGVCMRRSPERLQALRKHTIKGEPERA